MLLYKMNGHLRNNNNMKKLKDEFAELESFDTHVDVDYLVPQTWRPMPVGKTILGLSDNKIWTNDSRWAINNNDPYEEREMSKLRDNFGNASMREDSFSSITEDYGTALMQRTNYVNVDADAEWETAISKETAYKFDKSRQRYPQRSSRPLYQTEGTFIDTFFESPVRNQVSIARSNIKPRWACDNPREKVPMPRIASPGSVLTSSNHGQRVNNNPCIRGVQFKRQEYCPMTSGPGFTGTTPHVPSGGTLRWTPWN